MNLNHWPKPGTQGQQVSRTQEWYVQEEKDLHWKGDFSFSFTQVILFLTQSSHAS